MRAGRWDAVRNLTTYLARVQEVDVDVREGERVVVVMWHCHVAQDGALRCSRFGGGDGVKLRDFESVLPLFCVRVVIRQRCG